MSYPGNVVGKIDTVIRFLLYVLIFWLPYSPAVVESCVVTAFVLWVVKRILLYNASPNKNFRCLLSAFIPPSSFLNKPIGMFLLMCLVSLAGTSFPLQSWHGFFTKTLEWFIVYFLFLEVFTQRRHIITAFAVLYFTAVSTAIDGFVQFYITGRDIFYGHALATDGRVTAGFKHANLLGGYLVGIIPLTVVMVFLKSKKRGFYALAVFASIMLTWSLLLTFSRGAWIGIFLGMIFFLFFMNRKYFLAALLGATLLAGSIYVASPSHIIREVRLNAENLHSTFWWRKQLWSDSLKMISDRPLFGHGLNMYMRVFQEYRSKYIGKHPYTPTYAHNCFIQMAAEIGILGLGAFLWILFRLFQGIGESLRSESASAEMKMAVLGLLTGVFAFLVQSFLDNNLYSLQLSVHFWSMVGILVAIDRLLKIKDIRAIKEHS